MEGASASASANTAATYASAWLYCHTAVQFLEPSVRVPLCRQPLSWKQRAMEKSVSGMLSGANRCRPHPGRRGAVVGRIGLRPGRLSLRRHERVPPQRGGEREQGRELVSCPVAPLRPVWYREASAEGAVWSPCACRTSSPGR